MRDTLARLVAAGVIERVPVGSRLGFRAADVERLIETGYTLPDARRPATKATRRPAKRRAATPQRIADLPY